MVSDGPGRPCERRQRPARCATVERMDTTWTTRVRDQVPTASRSPRAGVALLLSGALLLAACGGDAAAPDPTSADTGVPLLEGTADPAASPTSDIAP